MPSAIAPVRAPDDVQATGGFAGGSQLLQYLRAPLITVTGRLAKVILLLMKKPPDTSPVVLRTGWLYALVEMPVSLKDVSEAFSPVAIEVVRLPLSTSQLAQPASAVQVSVI